MLLDETQDLCVKAERLVLVVYMNAGKTDLQRFPVPFLNNG